MTATPGPYRPRRERELGRLQASGKRTDDSSLCTLLVVHNPDRSWTVHGLGAPGITLRETEVVRLCGLMLRRVAEGWD